MKIKINVECDFDINNSYITREGLEEVQSKVSSEILDSFEDDIIQAFCKKFYISPEEISGGVFAIHYDYLGDFLDTQ